MTTLTVYSEAADGYIWGKSGVYASARSTSFGLYATANEIGVGQKGPGDYWVYRGFLSFDASALPDNVSISSATLYLTAYIDESHQDFNVQVYRYAWTETLTANREANYDGAYGATATLEGTFRNTASGWTPGVEYNMAVDSAGINLTGDTKYALVSSRDVGNTPAVNLDEYVQFNASESAAGKPRLVIEYLILVTNTLVLQWDVGGIVTNTLALVYDIRNSVGNTLTLQWDLRNTVSKTLVLVYDIREAVSKTLVLKWDLVSLAFEITFVWSILSICHRDLTLQWSSGGTTGATHVFIWGLITPVPLGRAICLPYTEYVLEIAEVH